MKKEKIFIWVFIVVVIILAIAAMTYQSYIAGQREKKDNQGNESQTPEPTPTPEESQGNLSHCLADPRAGNGMITIEDPDSLSEVEDPFAVKGTANVFEGSFIIKLKACDGATIYTTYGQASGEMGQNNPYSASISFDAQYKDTEAYLEAYSLSAKDGSVENLIQIPVRLK